MTQEPVTTLYETTVHDHIEAGLLLVFSDVTFMTVLIAAMPLLTILIIVVDYFNRRGRK
ncbi:hypothetical protein [Lysinibacillus sp. 54212]|uniref:hypothetical protein n=1 Tax=Lysinibacillus sp. 54212 TaxID=3119829 RepID=UPI002FCB04F5